MGVGGLSGEGRAERRLPESGGRTTPGALPRLAAGPPSCPPSSSPGTGSAPSERASTSGPSACQTPFLRTVRERRGTGQRDGRGPEAVSADGQASANLSVCPAGSDSEIRDIEGVRC